MSDATAPLFREVATPRNDLLVPVWSGLLRPQDEVLVARGGGRGLAIYDELERDARVLAVMRKRKLAVVARPWEVTPAEGGGRAARKAADLVEAALAGFNFDLATEDLLDAILKGFAVCEVIWQAAPQGILPVALKPKNQRRFVFDADAKLRLLTPQAPAMGEELPERKFVVHTVGAKAGDPYGLGLGSVLFWPCWFKRQGVAFWSVYAEKFGNPTPVGSYPEGAPDPDKDEVLRNLASLANDKAMVYPQGWDVKFLEATRSGTATYPDFVRYWDDKISEAVLGETLTTNIGDSGSRAASDTHNDVRRELTTADADLLSGTLNETLVRWVVDVNMAGAPYPTVFRPDPDLEADRDAARGRRLDNLVKAAQAIQAVKAAGFAPADPTADLDAQADGTWVPVPDAPAPAFAAPVTAPPTDDVDRMVETLDGAAAPMMDAMIGMIRDLLDTCASLDEVAQRLAALHPELDAAPLAALIENALVAADLGGRSAIADGPDA